MRLGGNDVFVTGDFSGDDMLSTCCVAVAKNRQLTGKEVPQDTLSLQRFAGGHDRAGSCWISDLGLLKPNHT